ncbi:MAG: hypothetical protein HRT57_01290 [Crocinitomicaceae bacterium]|nr:hypothetical protein [Crocinitomicaceae bacterium]
MALTTYQAVKIVFISPNKDGNKLKTLPRTFEKAMGMSIDGDMDMVSVSYYDCATVGYRNTHMVGTGANTSRGINSFLGKI